MKKIVRSLLTAGLFVLLILSCQRLVERPPSPEPAGEATLPVAAAVLTTPADIPAACLSVQMAQETPRRQSLPVQEKAADAEVNAPVRDGNGMPLADRSYVRTVHTACRLWDTSG